MGVGLQSRVGTVVVALMLLALPAAAESFSACWVATELDRYGIEQQITRCRISGGEIVDYASDSSVPDRLYPWPGTDLNGACWYYSSRSGPWVISDLYANGDALLGYTEGTDGSFAIIIGRFPRCTNEPEPASDPASDAWSYVTEYVHPPPTPELNPVPGDGVTGLKTYVRVSIPDDHTAQLTNDTGTSLDLFIEVSAVIIDWGDGETSTYPASPTTLSGYPDGIATHIYQTKDDYDITVSYDWTARWRVSGGTWQPLDVPNTSTSVAYPVSEIVSIIID